MLVIYNSKLGGLNQWILSPRSCGSGILEKLCGLVKPQGLSWCQGSVRSQWTKGLNGARESSFRWFLHVAVGQSISSLPTILRAALYIYNPIWASLFCLIWPEDQWISPSEYLFYLWRGKVPKQSFLWSSYKLKRYQVSWSLEIECVAVLVPDC